MQKILIAEDEPSISDLIALNLKTAGFRTVQVYDGERVPECIRDGTFDLVLLDIMLPGLDGFDLLPRLRKAELPVICLTAKAGLKDRITALDLGADDYITKPFEGLELIARVRAVLRRTDTSERLYSCGGVDVYPDRRKAIRDGVEIELTAREFDLLVFLLENRNRACSREILLERVWGYEYSGETRTVDMHVQKLRSKLGLKNLETVYKLGYRLED